MTEQQLMETYVIYKITTPNGKQYVGQTTRPLKVRIKEYQKSRNRKASYHYPIFRAVRKYGIDNLIVEIIDRASSRTQEELDNKEIYWIDKLKLLNNKGLNCNRGGRTGGTSKQSREMKLKLSMLWGKKRYIYNKDRKLVWSGYLNNEICEFIDISLNMITKSVRGEVDWVKGYWITTKKGKKYIPSEKQLQIARDERNEFAETLYYTVYKDGKKVGRYKGRTRLKEIMGFKYIRDVDRIIKRGQTYKGWSATYNRNHISKMKFIRYWVNKQLGF